MSIVLTYVVTLVFFVVLDALWLGTMAERIYRPLLGDILLPGFRAGPAVVFYLFYAVGLVLFAVAPALKSGNVGTALLWGALFGLFAYGTYDLTNYATLRNWGPAMTAIDMAWGTFASGAAGALSFLATRWLVRIFGL